MSKIFSWVILLPLVLYSCVSTTKDKSRLDSDNFKNAQERVEILKAEITSFSEFNDAEFELFNVNGFSNSRISLPGASSWNYKIAVKVDVNDVAAWTEGMDKDTLPENSFNWISQIVKERKDNWHYTSEPEYYKRGNDVEMLVYHSEGILFKQMVAN